MQDVQIFLSAVTAEFGPYRERIRQALSLPSVTVKTQEEFIPTGTETLDKLDLYIQGCDAVVHLVGDMTGAMAEPASAAVIRERYPDFAMRIPPAAAALVPGGTPLSYTQWEAWLALYHDKVLLIARPADGIAHGPRYRRADDQVALQQAHLAHLAECGRHAEITFADAQELAIALLRGLQPLLARIHPGWIRMLVLGLAVVRKAFWQVIRILLVAFLAGLCVWLLLHKGLPRMTEDAPERALSSALVLGMLVAAIVETVLHLRRGQGVRRQDTP